MLDTLGYTIAGGMLSVLATARVEQIAWRFLRLASIIPFALGAGCTASLWKTGGASAWVVRLSVAVTAIAALMVFIAPLGQVKNRLFRAVSAAGGAIGVAAACSCAVAAFGSHPAAQLSVTGVSLVILGQVLAAWVLGSITLAWLLGHAYLTATSMTIAPLKHFSRMLTWSVLARVLFVGISLAVAYASIDGTPSVLAQMGRAWLIAVLRFGVGLLAVGVFAFMVLDCVKLRATQSATGILYFGSVMAYVGELASQQLAREVGWPF
jgi:hypothetical protein